MFYDPMIAKLCSHGANREEAIGYMKTALSSFVIRGIAHNISFLEAIISHPRFIAGDINTDFIQHEYPDGFGGANYTSEMASVFLSVATHVFMREQHRSCSIQDQIIDQSTRIGTRWIIYIDEIAYPIFVKSVDGGFNIRNGQNKIYIRSNWMIGNKLFTGEVNNQKVVVKIEHIQTGYELTYAGTQIKVFVRSPRIAELESVIPKFTYQEPQYELKAPLSGSIISIDVQEGAEVIEGQSLVTLSAMKMENIITAEAGAIVKKILIQPGDHVTTGQILLKFV